MSAEYINAAVDAVLLVPTLQGTGPQRLVCSTTTTATTTNYIEAARSTGGKRPSFAAIHAVDGTEVLASGLALDKFIDAGGRDGDRARDVLCGGRLERPPRASISRMSRQS